MKNTRRGKIAAITAATLAISLLIGTGISDAKKSTSAINKAGAKQAAAIRAQSFAGKSNPMAIKRAAAKRAAVIRAQSFPRKSRFMLLGPALSFASAPRDNSFKALPLYFPDRTLRPPTERIPDPSDIPGMEDLEHFPGYQMIDQRWLQHPDRSPDGFVPDPKDPTNDYESANAQSDMSGANCLWDAATREKVSHWGAPGDGRSWGTSPDNGDSGIFNDDTICGTPDTHTYTGHKGGKDNKSGGTDDSGNGGDTTEKPKPTEDKVKETASQPDGKKDGPEGDDPDEFRSPIAEEMEGIDMASVYHSGNERRDGNPANGESPGSLYYGPQNGPPHGQQHRLGPNHKNRPDVMGSPVSSLVKANSMGYAASPTPDGGSNPPPGPEYSPVTSASSTAAGSTLANRMGYALSPAIGTDGKDPGPPPGPEF